MNKDLTPKAIVAALDTHIIGQDAAKRAVAVALRNRWRRQQLSADLRDEVTPKNILMIGPTGCGKTEISPAAWPNSPKPPSSKSKPPNSPKSDTSAETSNSIIRDLVEASITGAPAIKTAAAKLSSAKAEQAAEGPPASTALTGEQARAPTTRQQIPQNASANGDLEDREIELDPHRPQPHPPVRTWPARLGR